MRWSVPCGRLRRSFECDQRQRSKPATEMVAWSSFCFFKAMESAGILNENSMQAPVRLAAEGGVLSRFFVVD